MRKHICILLFMLSLTAFGQQGFRIAELNTENFFDCEHDSLKDDRLFLPSSMKRWSRKRYWNKLQNISKEIISIGEERPADLVALVEVENDSVLTHLTQKAVLRRAGYKYVMTNSNDHRGIDVALLYQPATFKVLTRQSLRVDFRHLPDIKTRDILYVCGKVYTGDTLHIFVCHFSSKIGGKKFTENYRITEAQTVRACVDSIQTAMHNAKIVILGDFNETPAERAVAEILNAHTTTDSLYSTNRLYNLSASITDSSRQINGTYKFNGQWEMLDQIIVSGPLLDSNTNFYTMPCNFHIHKPLFILQEDAVFSGLKPFRTYEGYRYSGGFSDHLPIYVDFFCIFP